MSKHYSWKAEWKAVGENPEGMTDEDREALALIPAQNEEFFRRFPAETIVPRILQKTRTNSQANYRKIAFRILPMVAAAAFAFLFLPRLPVDGIDDTRVKGNESAALSLYRQTTSGQAEALNPSKKVRPGDVLQATYLVRASVQGVVLSVDGNRNVTVHLADRGKSVPLQPGKEQPLEFSYELDRAPSYEAFFLFTSSRPFEIEPLKQILKSASIDTLQESSFGNEIRWTKVVLAKEITP